MTTASTPLRTDAQTLATTLAPALRETCGDRLHDISWFRADWQRGGAATGHALFDGDAGAPRRAIVKIPVGDAELRWTRRLQCADAEQVVPKLLASGETIAGFDIGWIVIERIEHGPLGGHWDETVIPRIARAAARFHAATAAYEIDRPIHREDWSAHLEGVREVLKANPIHDRQRWTAAIRNVQARVNSLVSEWRTRVIDGWVHGDLHPANAMCRAAGTVAPVTLIDLAEVRPGHWIEDAVYLERLHWARPDRLKQCKPVKEIAHARRELGLPVADGYQRLAAIRRVLLAATAPRFMKTEGHPAHLAACLERIESGLQELK